MPELPEVETIRRSLLPFLPREIKNVRFSKQAPIEATSPHRLKAALQKNRLITLARHGKYLLFGTDQDTALVVHLGMTGQLRFFLDNHQPLTKHTHALLTFSDGSLLRFTDPRRFGTLSLTEQVDFQDNPFLKKLGPDYLSPTLTPEVFMKRCRNHAKLSLKSLLLHQGVAAGLGNIYACEALYQAKLDPRKLVQQTSDQALGELLQAAQLVLEKGILKGGTTLRDYLDGLGSRGTMKQFLKVYGREGKPTLDNKGKVTRITQNGRSTFFCPAIQK